MFLCIVCVNVMRAIKRVLETMMAEDDETEVVNEGTASAAVVVLVVLVAIAIFGVIIFIIVIIWVYCRRRWNRPETNR